MERRKDESGKDPTANTQKKERRFQIVKLEERIAPGKGGKGTHNSCSCGYACYPGGYSRNIRHCI